MHYASLHKFPSVYDVVDSYESDSGTDFHQVVADMAQIPRTQAKTINLGLFYGMGKAKLQAELGVSKETAGVVRSISCEGSVCKTVDELCNEQSSRTWTDKNFTWSFVQVSFMGAQ